MLTKQQRSAFLTHFLYQTRCPELVEGMNSFVGLDPGSRPARQTRRPVSEHVPAVTAVILNWNRCEDTLACLASLQTVTYRRLHIVLVDNDSTDGTGYAVRQRVPDVEILETVSNGG